MCKFGLLVDDAVREILRYSVPSWLVGFYGVSTFLGYVMPNPFLYIYFKQFSLARVHSPNISISNYSF